MSLIGVQIDGVTRLRRRMEQVAERAHGNQILRRGMTTAARIVSRAQKAAAPIRKSRQKKWKAVRPIQRGTRPIGPMRLLPPGVLRRSIGFRIKRDRKTGEFSVVIGANVGKRAKSINFAPHAAFVGSGTVQRYAYNPRPGETGPRKDNRGIMPANPYIRLATIAAAPSALAALEDAVRADFFAEVAYA